MVRPLLLISSLIGTADALAAVAIVGCGEAFEQRSRHTHVRMEGTETPSDKEILAAATEASAATYAALEAEEQAAERAAKTFDIKTLAGVSPPLDFFDPAGLSEGRAEGTLRFWRDVEIKHGRVSMLAALGFPVAEHFHPLWGGTIDVPSYIAFQATPLQTFWPIVALAISAYEVNSMFSFERPYDLFYEPMGGPFQIRSDHSPGDMRWDPLNLKPSDPVALKEVQTKECVGQSPIPLPAPRHTLVLVPVLVPSHLPRARRRRTPCSCFADT
jgi:light-harvesting complex I chlorophyll a/b binding protein 4